MGTVIQDVILTPLKIIPGNDGDVLHAIKNYDDGFSDFGEAYFSSINCDRVKAWKRHDRMTLNIIVPIGEIRFVLYDEREKSATKSTFFEVNLSRNNYQRLTVPPGIWMGFQGISDSLNLLLNVADIPHNPDEVERCDLKKINYDWSIKK